MVKFCTLLLSSVLAFQFCYGQFTDSTRHLLNLTSTNSINKADGKSAYLFNNSFKFSVHKESVRLNFNNNWLYGNQNGALTNNDFSSSFDVNLYKTLPNFFYWGLVNYNTSFSLKIRNQLLTGAGVAYNLVDREKAYLNVSNGLLYDASSIFQDDIQVDYQTLRNSFRLAFRFLISDLIVISGTNFWQPSLRDGQDYNIRLTNDIAFRLNRWLSLNAALTYNRVNRTQSENLLFTYGLSFERYF